MKKLFISILLFASIAAGAQVPYVIIVLDSASVIGPGQQTVPDPTISPAGGEVASGSNISISTIVGAQIYYTTNGATPTISSTLYTGPFSITTAQTVKAIATKPNMITSGVASASFTIAPAASPDFPRLWWHSTSNPKNYDDATLKARIAWYDGITMGAPPGHKNNNKGLDVLVQQFHDNAIKPTGTKVFNYIVLNEYTHPLDNGYPHTAYQWFVQRIINANAWYYRVGTSGTRAISTWPGKTLVNLSKYYCPAIADGKPIVEWGPWAYYQVFKAGNATSVGATATPANAMDGFFVDNVFPYTKVQVDYDRNGTMDAITSTTLSADFRFGQRRIFEVLDSIWPTGEFHGNTATWRTLSPTKQHLDQIMKGGLIEGQYGSPTLSQPTTAGMMAGYKNQMDMYVAPKRGVFSAYVPTDTTVQDNLDKERYVMTAALMGDAYLCITNGDLLYNQTPRWLPEFTFNLGQAEQNPVYTPNRQSTVVGGGNIGYYREFENGIALMNPVGAGTRTYLLLGTFYKLNGWVAEYTVSGGDGTGVTSVTLRDGSGIVLSKFPTDILSFKNKKDKQIELASKAYKNRAFAKY